MNQPQAILVLPHLRIQNANAIGSPLTHGFPSVTAFTGVMWALERKLAQAGMPLQLQGAGVVCHHHQEQVTQGYVRNFNLTRNPVDKDGSTAAIVEEGRMHLQITLVLAVSEKRTPGTPAALVQGNQAQLDEWAAQAVTSWPACAWRAAACCHRARCQASACGPGWPSCLRTLRRQRRSSANGDGSGCRALPWWGATTCWPSACKRCAPPSPTPRCWTPGCMRPASTTRQSYLTGSPAADGQVKWADPQRRKGSGWVVPIPVGYAALTPSHAPGTVRNARDASVPMLFVESVYSLGEWISPHRLTHLAQLLWRAEADEAQGLYRCRNGYHPAKSEGAEAGPDGNPTTDTLDELTN